MLELRIDVRKKRRFLGGAHSISIRARLVPAAQLRDVPVARLFGRLVEELPESSPLRERPFTSLPPALENLRGRPRETFTAGEPLNLPEGEELMSVSGVVVCPEPLDDSPASGDDDEEGTVEPAGGKELPFFVTLGTRFVEFKNESGIVHRIVSRASNALQGVLPRLSAGALARMAPLRLERIRFGFESFSPRTWGLGLGGVPTVESRLFCEMDRAGITIEASRDHSKEEGALPFAEMEIFQSFDRALSTLGLYPDFYGELMRNVAR